MCLLLVAFSNSGPLLELRKGVGFALSPIQDTLRQGTRTATSIFSTINDIEQLRQQNEDLTRRIQEVEAENQRLQSLAAENAQLAALLEVRSSLAYDTVAAEVLNRLTTEQERVISIDRGTDAGIALDDPVLAEGGALVGRVIEVGPNFSRVLLINDTRTNVAGLIETSRALGDIHGNGERPLQMTNIPATDEVTLGESVVTAGIELETGVRSTYPKGLLIGQIVDVAARAEPALPDCAGAAGGCARSARIRARDRRLRGRSARRVTRAWRIARARSRLSSRDVTVRRRCRPSRADSLAEPRPAISRAEVTRTRRRGSG